MTVFLGWMACFAAAVALWFWRLFLVADAQRQGALGTLRQVEQDFSRMTHFAARQMADAIRYRNRMEVLEREQRLLNDLLAPRQWVKPSPTSHADIDDLMPGPLAWEDDPESYGV